jgi:hypothetical protein
MERVQFLSLPSGTSTVFLFLVVVAGLQGKINEGTKQAVVLNKTRHAKSMRRPCKKKKQDVRESNYNRAKLVCPY